MLFAGLTISMMCMVNFDCSPLILPQKVNIVKEAPIENKPEEKKEYLGDFLITYYCPCSKCSDSYGRHTSTGHIAKSEHTIAVDPNVIGYGTHVIIGDTEYVAEDCGGEVKGDHIDIFVDTHEETNHKYYEKVYLKRKE